MMAQAGLSRGSWGAVFLAASFLRNRGLVSNQVVTPEELWSGKKPTITHFRSFECKALSPIEKGMRGSKLGEVRKEGVLAGYSDEIPFYRIYKMVYDPVKCRILGELSFMMRWSLGGGDSRESWEQL